MKKVLFSPAFLILFLENFFFFTTRNSLNMLPPYLTTLGATKGFIGFFMNLSSLVLVIFVVFFTKMADRADKKKLLLTGFILQFFALIFMFLFPENLLFLLFMQFLASFSYAFGFTINAGLAFEIIPQKYRTGGIAIFGLSGVLAGPAGSYFGELIVKYLHPRYLFALSWLFCLLALILVFFIQKEKQKKEDHISISFWDVIKRKELFVLIIAGIMVGGGWSVLATFIPNFTKERLGMANLSAYFIANALIAFLSRAVFSRFIDRTSKRDLVMLGSGLVFFSMILTAVLHFPWQLYGIGLLYGLGHSILYPVLSAAFVDSGHDREKFSLNNTFIAFYTFGTVFVSTLFGLVGDFFGTVSIFISMALFALFCVPAAGLFIRKKS